VRCWCLEQSTLLLLYEWTRHQAVSNVQLPVPEQRIPADHPLRQIREITARILKSLSSVLGRMYARVGRRPISPEQLCRALLLQVLCTIRSERARSLDLMSDEHFTVGGTLLEGCVGLKSFKRKDGNEPPRRRIQATRPSTFTARSARTKRMRRLPIRKLCWCAKGTAKRPS